MREELSIHAALFAASVILGITGTFLALTSGPAAAGGPHPASFPAYYELNASFGEDYSYRIASENTLGGEGPKFLGAGSDADGIERSYGPFIVNRQIYYVAERDGGGIPELNPVQEAYLRLKLGPASSDYLVTGPGGRIVEDRKLFNTVIGLREFYEQTLSDPLFYSPELTGFDPAVYKGYEKELVTEEYEDVNSTHQDYLNSSVIRSENVVAHRFLRNLTQTADVTGRFLRITSHQNARILLSHYERTVSAYEDDFEDLVTIYERAHVKEDGEIVPQKARFGMGRKTTSTRVLAEDFRMVLENVERLREEVERRESILAGESESVVPGILREPLESWRPSERLEPLLPEEDWWRMVAYRRRMLPGDTTGGGHGSFRDVNLSRSYHAPLECVGSEHLVSYNRRRDLRVPLPGGNETLAVNHRLLILDAVPRRIVPLNGSQEPGEVETRYNGESLFIASTNYSRSVDLSGIEHGPSAGLGEVVEEGGSAGVRERKALGGPEVHRCLFSHYNYVDVISMDRAYRRIEESPPLHGLAGHLNLTRATERGAGPGASIHDEIRAGLRTEEEFLEYPSMQGFRELAEAYGRIYHLLEDNPGYTDGLPGAADGDIERMWENYVNMRGRFSGFSESLNHFHRNRDGLVNWLDQSLQDEPNTSMRDMISPVHVLNNALYPIVYTPRTPAVWRLDERPRKFSPDKVLPSNEYSRPGGDDLLGGGHRWVSDSLSVPVEAGEPYIGLVSADLRPVTREREFRNVSIDVNGEEILETRAGDWTTVEGEAVFREGENFIEFRSGQPCTFTTEDGDGERCLSFDLQRLDVWRSRDSVLYDGWTVSFGEGWYREEPVDSDTSMRWMGGDATLEVVSEEAGTITLGPLRSYHRPRNLTVHAGGEELVAGITTETRTLEVTVPEGSTTLRLTTPGCDVPSEVEDRSDGRCLSTQLRYDR